MRVNFQEAAVECATLRAHVATEVLVGMVTLHGVGASASRRAGGTGRHQKQDGRLS